MGNTLVGISSWTERTLIKEGNFYPPGAKSAEARLQFYASQFPIVEVDSTYYFPPSERNAILWIERTPKEFTFNIKAYSLLTNHPTKRESLYADLRDELPKELEKKRNLYREQLPDEAVEQVWQRFHDALMPLHSAGKLGAVLFQFPQWFVIARKNKEYLLECRDRLKDFRIAVEFRHKSWLEERNREETIGFLEDVLQEPDRLLPVALLEPALVAELHGDAEVLQPVTALQEVLLVLPGDHEPLGELEQHPA